MALPLIELIMRAKEDAIRQLTCEFTEHQLRVENIFNSFLAQLTTKETSIEQPPLPQSPPLSGAENNDESDVPLNLVIRSSPCELNQFASNGHANNVTGSSAFAQILPTPTSAFSPYSSFNYQPETNSFCLAAVKKEIVTDELSVSLTTDGSDGVNEWSAGANDGPFCNCVECIKKVKDQQQQMKFDQQEDNVCVNELRISRACEQYNHNQSDKFPLIEPIQIERDNQQPETNGSILSWDLPYGRNAPMLNVVNDADKQVHLNEQDNTHQSRHTNRVNICYYSQVTESSGIVALGKRIKEEFIDNSEELFVIPEKKQKINETNEQANQNEQTFNLNASTDNVANLDMTTNGNVLEQQINNQTESIDEPSTSQMNAIYTIDEPIDDSSNESFEIIDSIVDDQPNEFEDYSTNVFSLSKDISNQTVDDTTLDKNAHVLTLNKSIKRTKHSEVKHSKEIAKTIKFPKIPKIPKIKSDLKENIVNDKDSRLETNSPKNTSVKHSKDKPKTNYDDKHNSKSAKTIESNCKDTKKQLHSVKSSSSKDNVSKTKKITERSKESVKVHQSPKPKSNKSNYTIPKRQSCSFSRDHDDVNIVKMQCFLDGCDELFTSKELHNQHMKDDHGLLPVLCPVNDCTRSFHDKKEWTDHAKFDHRSTRWPCGKCDKVTNNSWDLFKHATLYHQEGVYRCSKLGCDFMANTKNPVIEHFEQDHKNHIYSIVSIKCHVESCKETVLNSQLEAHLKTHPKPFGCLACNQAFQSEFDLNDHVKKDHQDVITWLCNTCGKSWNKHDHLQSHIIKYHQEGMFRCNMDNCPFLGSTRTEVVEHYDKDHPNQPNQNQSNKKEDEIKPSENKSHFTFRPRIIEINCPRNDCKMTFPAGKCRYNEHLLQCHKILPFQCMMKECNKSFNSMSELNQHLAKNHNGAVFRCSKCPGVRKSHILLYQHWIDAHQQGKFGCTQCTFEATFSEAVIQHYAQVHSNQSQQQSNRLNLIGTCAQLRSPQPFFSE